MYKPTVQDMLSNAFNNWRSKPADQIAMPKDRVTQIAELLRGRYEVVAVESIERGHLILAMEAYHANTDWSAFKREDWQAAWDFLFTPGAVTAEG
jgi:hypothetical protein